ncbi:hypothetical protein GCM10029992_07770 [Glycomyces albus]
MERDIRSHSTEIAWAIERGVQRPTGPRQFGNWTVTERIGGDEEITEYRARNTTVETDETVLLRVYRADPFQGLAEREQRKFEVGNAYRMLRKLPRHECVVFGIDCFPVEDGSAYALVLEDVRGRSSPPSWRIRAGRLTKTPSSRSSATCCAGSRTPTSTRSSTER